MITKYNIGDEVLVRAKVIAIGSDTKGQIIYTRRRVIWEKEKQ